MSAKWHENQFDTQPWPEVWSEPDFRVAIQVVGRGWGKAMIQVGHALHAVADELVKARDKQKRSQYVLFPGEPDKKPTPTKITRPKPYWQQGPAYDRRGRKRF